ncbi:hypothetical protein DFA_10767 [Cavenderia fasciculata]|uniref:Uncharacterized protein n=1 Tax=Cavenderia fasciculata TaxID=261658 RepID=F4QBC2_CACFS|nr:uncharacterized protein DFA_10767 [Cavenderia fasciculata]EGG14894.1 hypothetical protein DFA_10767 [Cavenderia fasciculata]|eukprot:XP_004351410.1 hypothetical protein DFA_10767 [Cavenderia fasciculata]
MLVLSDYIIAQIISVINDDIDKICFLITCKRLIQLRRLTRFKTSDNRSNFVIDNTKFNNNIALNTSSRGVNNNNSNNNNNRAVLQESDSSSSNSINSNSIGNNNNNNNEHLLLFLPFNNQEQIIQRSNYLISTSTSPPTPSSPSVQPVTTTSSTTKRNSLASSSSSSNEIVEGCDSGSSTPFIYIVDKDKVEVSPSLSSMINGDSTLEVENELKSLYDQHYQQYQQSFTHLKFMVAPLTIKPSMIPSSVTHLNLGKLQSTDSIIEGCLPDTLIYLNLGFLFDQPLGPDILPPRLTHLSFGANFQSPTLCLPQSITHLRLGSSYSHSIQLPTRIKELCLLYQPNSTIQFPQSITHLTWFIENIEQFLLTNDIMSIKPNHVTHLCLASNYNYPLPCSLNPLFSERDRFGYWLSQSNTNKLIDQYHFYFTGDNPFVHLSLATDIIQSRPLPTIIKSLSTDRSKSFQQLNRNLIGNLDDFGCFVNHHSIALSLITNMKRFSVSTLWGEDHPILGTITYHLRKIDNWLLVVSGIDGTGGFIELTDNNLNSIDSVKLLSTIFLNKYKSRNPSLF